MSPTTKRYLLSSLTTFITVAIATLAVQLGNGAVIMWTTTFWASVALTVVRAGFKAVVEGFAGQTGDAV